MGQQPFRLTPEQLEARRLFAASLLKSGWRPVEVADECGVTRGTVSHRLLLTAPLGRNRPRIFARHFIGFYSRARGHRRIALLPQTCWMKWTPFLGSTSNQERLTQVRLEGGRYGDSAPFTAHPNLDQIQRLMG